MTSPQHDSPPNTSTSTVPPTAMNPESDAPRQTSDRPPGGTRRSGTKTPRKVQWDFGDNEPPHRSDTATRGLDEAGLNPEPFQALTNRLEKEKERSSTSPTSETPLSPPSPDIPTPESREEPAAVPGENFIGENETAGLPGKDIDAYAQRQADRVVQAHKHGFLDRIGLHRHPRIEEPPKAKWGFGRRHEREHRPAEGPEGIPMKDIEQHAEAESARSRRKFGTGVLSALLGMYDQAAGSVSGASTPARSTSAESPPPTPPATREQGEAPRSPVSRTATTGSTTSISSLKKLGQPISKAIQETRSRPPPMRSSAGVFGPLIASTGNIIGAAAPLPGTIGPTYKRPGYGLSRYSVESGLPRREEPSDQTELRRSQSFPHLPFRTGSAPPESTASQATEETLPSHHVGRTKWSGMLKDLPKITISRAGTPSTPGTPDTDVEEWLSKQYPRAEDRRKERRRRRKKAEIYITRHIAEIIQRQEFILKLTRAMMMFGGPSHRLQAQIQSTAHVLDIPLACLYLPDVMLISFDDSNTSTSNLKFIRQPGALNLGKLQDANKLHWKVLHDEISVTEAGAELDGLMRKPEVYNRWELIVLGGLCSAFICSVAFNGSFIDSLMSFPLGCLLIIIQLFAAARHELYSNVFEITVATLFSFISAALAASHHFCYAAVAASSIVLILPGYVVLVGALELSTRNIISGSVRVCFALIYALFLGFGLAIGETAFAKITNRPTLGQQDVNCSESHHPNGPWWQRTPAKSWAFLTVPMYSLCLSLRNQAPWDRIELVLLVTISSMGWVVNYFTGLKFPSQSAVPAAAGALAVGFVSNLYGRFFSGNAFAVMITGILFQLPSGLANGGLFTFASKQEQGSSTNDTFLSGFQTALQLISVSIGLTVGLGISLVLIHPTTAFRRRGSGIFSL